MVLVEQAIMKYVMTNYGPIVFSELLSHVMFKELEKHGVEILSAGFSKISTNEVETFGYSESLDGAHPHKDDVRMIEAMCSSSNTLLNMLVIQRNEETEKAKERATRSARRKSAKQG